MVNFSRAFGLVAVVAMALTGAVDGKCKGDEEYKFCGTACPRVCGKPLSADTMCTMNCVEGCFCPQRSQWHDPATGRCYDRYGDCPEPATDGAEVIVDEGFF